MKKSSKTDDLTSAVAYFWPLFLAEGLAMMFLGLLALVLPFIAALGMALLVGLLLFAAGVFGLLTTIFSKHVPGYWWSLLSSVLTMLFGIAFFAWPFGGEVPLAATLSGFLAADGILAIAVAWEHRRHLTPKWNLLLASGCVSLAGAAFLAWWVPQADTWTLDAVIGIDLLVSGGALCLIALDARQPSQQNVFKARA